MFNNTKITFAFLLVLVILMAGKCWSENPEAYKCPDEPAAEVDPAHAQFSPVARQLMLQLRKSDSCKARGNVKLFVQYDVNEYNKDSLAFINEGTKVVLRDDGVFPDALKNDQEYTAFISIDTAHLKRIYVQAAAAILKSMRSTAEKISFVNFNGREVISSNSSRSSTDFQRFNFDDFAAGKKTALTIDFPVLETVRNHCLYVIDTKVVEDPSRTWIPSNPASNPSGAWSFMKIMEGLANTASTGISAEDFTMHWLQTWKTGGTINGDIIQPRNMDGFINAWPKSAGKLDLTKSPFKLAAIVNRLDLMPNPVFNITKNGGELRFVFVVMNPQNPSNPLGSGDIIFEFGVNKTGRDLMDYAEKWYELKDLSIGSPEYNNKLEGITNEIIGINAEPSKPNGSNLNQLRTNEILFGGWQLREFTIDPSSHQVKGATIKQEPAGDFNDTNNAASSAKLKQFADENEQKIIRNHYTIPEKLKDGSSFLGGKSDYPSGGIWGKKATSIANNQARFVLSINTCSGCHLSEAGTGFLHNSSVGFETQTQLSGFIKGNAAGLGNNLDHFQQADPRPGVPAHSFNDLARRSKVLWGFTNSHPTLFGLQYNPVNMEH